MNSSESEFPRLIQSSEADGEFFLLVSLFDDPVVCFATAIDVLLRQRCTSILHPLLDFIDLSAYELAKRRATVIAREFNEQMLLEEFTALRHKLEQKKRGALEEGVFLISRYAYPR